jgi:hypothetical protein
LFRSRKNLKSHNNKTLIMKKSMSHMNLIMKEVTKRHIFNRRIIIQLKLKKSTIKNILKNILLSIILSTMLNIMRNIILSIVKCIMKCIMKKSTRYSTIK